MIDVGCSGNRSLILTVPKYDFRLPPSYDRSPNHDSILFFEFRYDTVLYVFLLFTYLPRHIGPTPCTTKSDIAFIGEYSFPPALNSPMLVCKSES